MISRFNNITQTKTLNTNNNRPKQKNSQQAQPSFKGPVDLAVAAGTQTLNFLNTSPAIGACFVDFFSMVLPRTIVDSTRSKDAGMETAFREGSGTFNHGLAGFVGLGAGYLVSSAFNKANGVRSHLVFTNNDAFDVFSEFINKSSANGAIKNEQYYRDIAKNMEFLNTTNGGAKSYTNIVGDDIPKKFAELMTQDKTDKYKLPKDIMKEVQALFIGEKGSGATVRLTNPTTGAIIEDSIENHIKNAFSVNKVFAHKLKNDAKELAKSVSEPGYAAKILDNPTFINSIKKLKTKTAVAGLAIPLTIGMGTQPLNRYLTKKRTGKEGFVGVEGREPDKSNGFKAAKVVLGLAMGSAMVSTILKSPSMLYKKPLKALPEILSNLQYKGMVPTMNQFKFIYGMTIMSRIFAVRDKNEMRESAIKDSLGFANWLILGGFVSKLASRGFSKLLSKKGVEGIINYDSKEHGVAKGFKKLGKFITKSVEKTHEEILYPALEKAGIKVLENGKALPFRKLMKDLAEKAKADPTLLNVYKETSSRLKYKNWSQLIGYAYSGLVLGYGITKLNIAITKAVEKPKNKGALAGQNDKMKISNEFMKQNIQKDNKTFGAFLNSL